LSDMTWYTTLAPFLLTVQNSTASVQNQQSSRGGPTALAVERAWCDKWEDTEHGKDSGLAAGAGKGACARACVSGEASTLLARQGGTVHRLAQHLNRELDRLIQRHFDLHQACVQQVTEQGQRAQSRRKCRRADHD
jgi:hypothetical protein